MKRRRVEIPGLGKSGDHAEARPTPWVEKYRPKSMDEVAYQEEVKRTLTKSIETGNLPHLLFYGPPGTGKTSTILAIARQLYGPELAKERVRELNASDERGIKVIRAKVKKFAQLAIGSDHQGHKGKYPCPPYKIIVLDEADCMTSAAQAALRRVMERYSKVTRFCLICNYVSRIIDPVASRCAKFRFKPLSELAMQERLQLICDAEGINIQKEALSALLRHVNGDLRNAITLLQTSATLHRGVTVTPVHVTEVLGGVPDNVISSLVGSAKSRSFPRLEATVKGVCAEGYPSNLILSKLNDLIVQDDSISNLGRAMVAQVMAEADKCLIEGADEQLQLLNVLCALLAAVDAT